MESITIIDENNEEKNIYVIETTTIGGINYYLATESEDEDDDVALIFKDMSDKEDEEAILAPVEDDAEYEAVAKVFESLLEGDISFTAE